jgi:hypothetical protein
MKKDNTAHFRAIRKELAEELGYDFAKLTAVQSMRVDVVFGLKSSLDEMRARMFEGEKVDTNEMRQIADTLEKFLPAQAKPDPIPAIYREDPHKVLEDIVQRWIDADAAERAERVAAGLPADPDDPRDVRIAELEAEVAKLRGAQPAPAPALPAGEQPIDPPTGDIVGPREQPDRQLRIGADPSSHPPKPVVTIDGKPLRPGMGADGKPIPPQACSGDEAKRRMAKSNADRATAHTVMTSPSRVAHEPTPSTPMTVYGDSGFHWGGAKGRAW